MGEIAIIGAGIAGLGAAYALKLNGHRPTVFEAADYPGGRIKTVRKDGFVFDIGAYVYLGTYFECVELMKKVGLESEIEKNRAYGAMPRNGDLHFLDLDKPVRSILSTKYVSGASKLKAVKLFQTLMKHWKDLNYDDAQGIAKIDSDSVESFCKRELNDEIYDYVASVVLRGSWLANPEWSSIGQMLWTMKNFFKPYFYGLSSGMDALPVAVAKQLDVKLNTRALNVEDRGDKVLVTYQENGGEARTQEFDGCIIATPTDVALDIYEQMPESARKLYERTEYIAGVSTHIGLSTMPSHDATYVMVSPKEHRDLSGVIVDHRKASGRAPEGKANLTVFCRHEWCLENMETPDDQVIDAVTDFIEPYFGDVGNQIESYAIGRWPQVVPKMPPGRFREIADYQQSRNINSRIQLASDLEPIGGVNAALVSGQKAAGFLHQLCS